jgi:putative ABC transport system substrate-binding protein
MKRREFMTLLGGAAATWPPVARAQQPNRMRLIGVLLGFTESDPAAQSQVAALGSGLSKLRWQEFLHSGHRIILCYPGGGRRGPHER